MRLRRNKSIIPNFARLAKAGQAKFAPKGLHDKTRRGFCRLCKVSRIFLACKAGRYYFVHVLRAIKIWDTPLSRPNSCRIWPSGLSLSLEADFSCPPAAGEEKSGITLLELLIAIVILGMIALGFGGIQNFSQFQVLTTDRRARVQNEASYALDHIAKYVQQATGELSSPGIADWSSGTVPGFRVRIDLNNTPSDYSDDRWVGYYVLNSMALMFCSRLDSSFTCAVGAEQITGHLSSSGGSNFIYGILENASGVEVTIKTLWDYNKPVSADNPEAVMQARMYSHSVSTN